MTRPEDESLLPIRAAEAPFPTIVHGDFKILVYEKGRKEYAVLIKGNVEGEENVPVRIESACVTGTALHSAGCDCSQQLDRAFDIVTEHGSGVIMYMLPEEGRGLGLAKKIRIYAQMAKRG